MHNWRLVPTFGRFIAAWTLTLAVSVLACLLCCLLGPSRAWLCTAKPWARATLAILGVRLRVEGEAHLKAAPAVFISNHQSLIDVVFMPALLPRQIRFVAKRELLWIPFLGWAFAAGGAVLIDRARPRQALRELYRGLKRLPQGWSLLVFPEGTRSKDGQVKAFKKGAFHMAMHTKLPIVPIGMDGAREIVPPDGWLVRAGEVRICIGPPLPSCDWRPQDTAANLAAGQAAVAACVAAARARRPGAAAAAAAAAQAS